MALELVNEKQVTQHWCISWLCATITLVKFQRKRECRLTTSYPARSKSLFFTLPSIIFLIFVQALELVLGFNFPNIELPTLFTVILLMDIVSGTPLALWGILWLISIIQASRDMAKPISLTAKFSNLKVSKAISDGWGIFFQVGIILIFFVIMRANQLANQSDENTSVYLLYETFDPIPRWVFATGFYPIAEIANTRWGEGSVGVEPLTKKNIDKALRNGRLVVLASHGGYSAGTVGLSFDPNDNYSPADVYRIGGAGPDLQFVYISGCNTGALETEWTQSLLPAKVITFNRISWATEHAIWLWTDGIKVALEIK